MVFEAKSQYIPVYFVFARPFSPPMGSITCCTEAAGLENVGENQKAPSYQSKGAF